MSNTDPETAAQDIRQPVLHEPDALVENIYSLPGTDVMPDLESQDVMGEFLIDRFEPDEGPRTRLALRPSGFTFPAIERVPSGVKEVTRWRRLREWLIRPRTAAAVTLGSLALFNAAGNRETIVAGAEAAGHAIYRVFDPVEDQKVTETHTVPVPGQVRTISVTAATNNEVGATTVDPIVIRQFIDSIHSAEQQGAKVDEVSLVGNTSDEWSSEQSIGVADGENDKLGHDRAQAAEKALTDEGFTVDSSKLQESSVEHVLNPEQAADVEASAQAEGFKTVKAAVVAVDSGRPVSPGLVQKIKNLFTSKENRGVSLSAQVETPGQTTFTTTTTTRTIPGKDNAPHVPKPGFFGFIPLLPIRRRERYTKVKQLHEWHFTPSKRLYFPEIIREEQDQAWVRLRPEAVNEDGTLVDHAWAYTRKYEHLMRDNRIMDMLRADYKDANGDDKSLRLLFIDHFPSEETIEVFGDLLKTFANMEDGKLGSRVSGIFVYPTENAGIEHGDPKRIAMGLDKQSPFGMLGTFTYALDLVELHMPVTWEPEELHDLFESFNGPAWTTSHEVAGHGTDESDATLRVRPVRTRNIPNAHIIEGDPRARKMARLDNVLHKLSSRWSRQHAPIEFDISYPVQDNEGRIVTMQARVGEDDPRLAHATHATVVGYRPTQYAGTNESEHYAETAASVTTGIAVPYDEAVVSVPTLQSDDGETATFATGYRPDQRGQRLFTRSVGATPRSFPVEFENPVDVTVSQMDPADDPVVHHEMARTSRLRSIRPDQMIAILARIARTRR